MRQYAQDGTDLAIAELFPADYIGRFVDAGAAHPISDSNTYLFYLKGWRGISIDPIKSNIDEHKRIRPEDTQIQCCVGSYDGVIDFFECNENTVSTCLPNEAAKREASGQTLKRYESKIYKLDTILKSVDHSNIDLLSIDVEGAERDVLMGYKNLAAKVVVMESYLPCTLTPCFEEWEWILLSKNYEFVRSTGVNRIYQIK